MAVYPFARRTEGRAGPLAPVEFLTEVTPAAFPQRPGSLDWLLGPALQELPQSEDAFHIAAYAPANAENLPVMVFLPGGAFVSGAGTVRWYDAQAFAEAHQCVVFVPNYRLGLPAHRGTVGGGNQVPEELLLALRWVQRNARAFGADPAQVTLAGQSAGAFWAFALAQLPEAQGLFQRLYLGSLTWQPPMTAVQAAERQEIVDEHLGRGGIVDADLESLLDAQSALAKNWAGRGLGLYPSADDAVPANLFDVTAAAERFHVDQVLLTSTRNEAAAFLAMAPEQAFTDQSVQGFVRAHFAHPEVLFGRLSQDYAQATPKELMIQAMTLHQIELYAIELADALAAAGAQVQFFRFDVQSKLPGAQAAHCLDLPFLFGNAEHWHDAPMLADLNPGEYQLVSEQFGNALASFIRSGTAYGLHDTALPVHNQAASEATALAAQGFQSLTLERDITTLRELPVTS